MPLGLLSFVSKLFSRHSLQLGNMKSFFLSNSFDEPHLFSVGRSGKGEER